MKKSQLLIFLLLPLFCLAQKSPVEGIISKSQQQIFVNNIWIDSIPSRYAEITVRKQFDVLTASFNYGQNRSLNSNLIRNSKSDLISFESIAEILNVLYYNGWDFIQEIEGMKKEDQLTILVRKKTN